MAHPYHHALSSAKKYGGKPESLLAGHDQAKAHAPKAGHQALPCPSSCVFLAEHLFVAATALWNS